MNRSRLPRPGRGVDGAARHRTGHRRTHLLDGVQRLRLLVRVVGDFFEGSEKPGTTWRLPIVPVPARVPPPDAVVVGDAIEPFTISVPPLTTVPPV